MSINDLLSDHNWRLISGVIAGLTLIQGLINRFTNFPGGIIGGLVIVTYFFSYKFFGWIGPVSHIVLTVALIIAVKTMLGEYKK